MFFIYLKVVDVEETAEEVMIMMMMMRMIMIDVEDIGVQNVIYFILLMPKYDIKSLQT